MASARRAFACTRYGLYKLLSKPKLLAALLFMYLYMDNHLDAISAFLTQYGEKVNGFGLFSQLLADPYFVLVAGLVLLLILGDAPFYDGAQCAVLLRAGRMPWLIGQIGYIMVVTGLYLVALVLLQHVVLNGQVEYAKHWGRALNTLAKPSVAMEHGVTAPIYEGIVTNWTVRRCFALSMTLRWVAYVITALIMFAVNLRWRGYLGVFFALFVLLMDIVIETGMPYALYIASISSLARLSILDFGYNPYLPDAEISMTVLSLAFFGAIALALLVGRKSELAQKSDG
ncbi:MAG: hypothetical protein RSD95_11315 [Clostridia bacterium]